jgi:PEGA domain
MASERRSRPVPILAAIALALAGFSASSIVRAEPSSADKETARHLLKEGDEKFRARDFAGALKAYQAAHAIIQVPTTGLSLAKAQIERGLLVEARDTLLQVTRSPRDPNEPPAFSRARDEATPLAQRLAERIPSLTIVVEGVPSDASVEVAIDGAAIPVAVLGAPRKVNPGAHVLTAHTKGFKPISRPVNLGEGDNEKITLKLVAGESESPPLIASAGAKLSVTSSGEEGNVFVDGKAAGVTPLVVPVTPGMHRVEVEYPGGSHDDIPVDVAAGATANVEAHVSPMDAIARHRKGVRLGVAAGPTLLSYLDGGETFFGGSASLFINIGVTPVLDFRTGAALWFVARDHDKSWHLAGMIPAMLKINYTPWFSAAAGLTFGFAYTTSFPWYAKGNADPHSGFVIGPAWSPFTLSAGEKRQFEFGVTQGVHFGGDRPPELHQSLVFTYLWLD